MTTADRLEFAPPPTAGLVRALGLAIVAHVLLVAALTWGVQWNRDVPTVTAQAELWSAVPQTAAPKLVEPPPAAPVRVAPAPPPAPVAPKVADAEIALERDKLRLKREKQQAEEKLELAQQREKLRREKREQEKAALEKKREQQEKLAQEKKKEELDAKREAALKAHQEAQKLEAQRQANLQRMAGLAGSAGASASTGTALQTSGPSASYGGRVAAKVKPNIVFTEEPIGNPMAEVEVRASPDGTIISRKLVKSSGTKAWDEAVLKAIDKTETLPRDVDGRVPSPLLISFRPRD